MLAKRQNICSYDRLILRPAVRKGCRSFIMHKKYRV